MRFVLLFFLAVFAFAKPLEEVVKDIEVSGEARYRFEYSSSKKEQKQRVQIPTKKPVNLR